MVSGLTKYTLFDGAKMYAAAADAVNDRMPNSLHVLSHLLCTSIELALKSYLVHIGYSENQLRRIGQDLPKLFQAVVDGGLDYTGSRNFVLTVSGALYKHRIFAYPENANMTIILPGRLRQMTSELINDVHKRIFTKEEQETLCLKGFMIESSYPEEIDSSEWYNEAT